MTKTTKRKKISTTIYSKNQIKKLFHVVEVDKLSIEDKFLQYEPETKIEELLKKDIIEAIEKRIPNFRAPIMAPSEDEFGNIIFKKGCKPAVGHYANWWKERIKYLLPEKNARMGSMLQHAAFLAILIKKLIKEKEFTVREAWKAICFDSRVLINPDIPNNQKLEFQLTGTPEIGKWCDLTSVGRLLKKKGPHELLLAHGCSDLKNSRFCLADIITVFAFNGNFTSAVAWIVMDV